jgi:hypothetical protein
MGFADARVDGSTLSIAVSDAVTAAPAIVRRLVAAGADIEAVVPEDAPLEEVYLRLLESDAASRQ